jgi:hypothetical protein
VLELVLEVLEVSNAPNIAQRHALPQKGLQRKHFCFRIELSSAEARIEGMNGGSVGAGEGILLLLLYYSRPGFE